ncbi:hypothetical protein N7447_007785 [Penicillium robsamsonii]|uniref:uncharacterized protein n=1 Tax=Penicillium robsamsonii TaxID=1792511 RepID=UPI002548E391|nr:uncharacterized protein N7447_007785 [Penicillium robsamsonii]KAJ5817777.1 hypothetical protein N7447_007785 [Penicillium robsamsonii]
MSTNMTYPVCPVGCRDPDAWKGQLIAGMSTLDALVLVLGAVMWIVRFNAGQARLGHPQSMMTEEYLERKKKCPWWKVWAEKGDQQEPLPPTQERSPLPGNTTQAEKKKKWIPPPRPANPARSRPRRKSRTTPLACQYCAITTWLCCPVGGTSPTFKGQTLGLGWSSSRRQPDDVDADVLSNIKKALKGKDRG